MKLPNKFGSVHKLPGKRRNPWRARKTKGWLMDEETGKAKQQYITIGYYATRQEAMSALVEYNKDPYDIASNTITFAEVYERWSKVHFEKIVPSAARTWKSAFNHSAPLHSMRMRDIRVEHLEQTILNADIGEDTKQRMKSLYNLMYKYAMKHEIVNKNYAELCDRIKKTKKSLPKVPFSEDEIKMLWDNLDFPFVDMVLIGIYSGWRPQELAILKSEDINLDELTMRGGLKTDAGRNRLVPIHSKVLPLIEKRMAENKERVFNDPKGQQGTEMTYDKYRERFKRVMEFLHLNHKPHETRHTFITRAKEAGMDEYALKLIVGHAIEDVTERVYTHRTIDNLKAEIEKIQ